MNVTPELSPLQLGVLDRYQHLARSLRSLDDTVKLLGQQSDCSPEQVLKRLREIEVKIALVGTLLKGAVYSLILQRSAQQPT